MDTNSTNGFSTVGDLAALPTPTVTSLEAAPPVVGDQDGAAMPVVQAVTPSLKLVKQEVGEWFGKAFDQICAACPRWRYSLPTDEMVKNSRVVWIQALAESGITTKAQVNHGIKRLAAANREYLPTVADFIAMCKDTGTDGKWPGLEAAKKEILVQFTRPSGQRKWSSRFVAYLAGKVGASAFHPTTAQAVRDLAFESEYLAAVDVAESGYFDRPERKGLMHETDPNVAYYFQLLEQFPHMPGLAEGHLKACAAKGFLIEIDLENKTGKVARVDVSLMGEQVKNVGTTK